jgi:hypothetical protein
MRPTDDQIKELANKLRDTQQNCFRVAESMGLHIEDADFDRLATIGQVFKCEECDEWQALSEQATWRDDLCLTCDEDRGDDE